MNESAASGRNPPTRLLPAIVRFPLTRIIFFIAGILAALWLPRLVAGGLSRGRLPDADRGVHRRARRLPLSGAALGVEGSVFAIAICLLASLVLLGRVRRKNQFIRPVWRRCV